MEREKLSQRPRLEYKQRARIFDKVYKENQPALNGFAFREMPVEAFHQGRRRAVIEHPRGSQQRFSLRR
jgi:hypothetical protein